MSTLQTLDRGIRALHLISRHTEGVSVAEIAKELDVHRAIAYRIVSTLAEHGLAVRQSDGRIYLGVGVLEFETRFVPQFRSLAQPFLQILAAETLATAFVSAVEGDECAAIMVAEPENVLVRVGYRVGSRHLLTKGAAGIAILAARQAQPTDSEAVCEARRNGFSVTRGELQTGAVGVASPILLSNNRLPHFGACVGVVAMEDIDVEKSSAAVVACSNSLSNLLID